MTSDSGLQLQSNEDMNLPRVNISRRLYMVDTLKVEADYHARSLTLGRTMRKMYRNCEFGECIRHSVPIIQWLPKYRMKEYLAGDIISGITIAIMHIPQGIAFALLAHVPPIVGLYMAFFPLIIYIVLGNSPHVSMGSFAVACIMNGKVVLEYANKPMPNGVTYTPIEIVTVQSFLVGLIQVIMWVLRLGIFASLLSDPMVSGFTTAAAIHVCASQLKDLFGVNIPPQPGNFTVINTLIELFKTMVNTNLTALLISFITCLTLALANERFKPWFAKRSRVPFPTELIAVVLGPIVCKLLSLREKYNVTVVGHIPTGLPIPSLPPLEMMGKMVVDGLAQTMVTYTLTLSMGLIFAAKEKYEIDANQELLAMGASNLFSSFFSCAPMCASLSRSYIQYTLGCKTLIATAICAVLMLLVLLWIGPFFEELPRCVLASVICVALKGLFMQLRDVFKFNKLSKIDAVVWLFTFLVTLLVDLDIGLMAGLFASVCSLFVRDRTAYVCLLGRVLDTDIYLDVKRYRNLQCVIFDGSGLSYIDVPGIRMLVSTHTDLAKLEVTFLLASLSDPITEQIEKFNAVESIKLTALMFATIHDAVVYFQAVTPKSYNPTTAEEV